MSARMNPSRQLALGVDPIQTRKTPVADPTGTVLRVEGDIGQIAEAPLRKVHIARIGANLPYQPRAAVGDPGQFGAGHHLDCAVGKALALSYYQQTQSIFVAGAILYCSVGIFGGRRI